VKIETFSYYICKDKIQVVLFGKRWVEQLKTRKHQD